MHPRVISSRIAGLALALGLCGLACRSAGSQNRPTPVNQARDVDLSPAMASALAGRSFEYWTDRELPGSSSRCDTPESAFRASKPMLGCTVTFSEDGRAIHMTRADRADAVSLHGHQDRADGGAFYRSESWMTEFRVSLGGSLLRAELTDRGSGVCVVARTRGTLRLASARAP